jgi:transcriptional regulator of arginine metabolism
MNKNEIDAVILSLVEKNHITNQRCLQHHLKAMGYDIPQATISRHLKKIGIIKINKIYHYQKDYRYHPAGIITKINISDIGLIVVHTLAGHASSVAVSIDSMMSQQLSAMLLGTIAGDDTVLLIPAGKNDAARIVSKIKQHFNIKQSITS